VKEVKERAILVGAIHGSADEFDVRDQLEELSLLASTAGANVVGSVTQKLVSINPAYFIGKGKAEQVVHQARELGVDLVIFNDELSPAQTKNFQKLDSNIKIIDRSALILDIFKKHAKTRESKTQVELAHLQYLLPRLTRMWTHLERQMGGIGTRAGAGETQIEVDRRLIRDRITKLKKDLKKIDQERIVQSKRRKDIFRVALVGYTNAGKSTLMRAISSAEVVIEDQLFATLDTTVRAVEIDTNHKILLSDTVGFIRKLPHHLVASFRNTLREALEADLLLIVLDAASEQIKEHYNTIEEVLKTLKADHLKSLLVLNKIDLVQDEVKIPFLKREYPKSLLISAKNHLRIDHLLNKIKLIMDEDYMTTDIHYSYDKYRDSVYAQSAVEVLERNYTENGIDLKIRGPKKIIDQILNSNNN
jgi:GTP-binding protein HflX